MSAKTPSRRDSNGSKARTVDLVTGKTKIEYFLDPSLLLPPDQDEFSATARTPIKRSTSTVLDGDDALFASKHLFVPCTIVKDLEQEEGGEEVPALVKTGDGQLHKIRDRTKLTPLISPEDYTGIPDVLHLPSVTEASLLHSLRLRYARDEIYTSAGPILMSVNPYKSITLEGGDLYGEERMMLYQKSTGSVTSFRGDGLPCHLFQVASRAYSSLLESTHAEFEPHLEEEDPFLMMEKDHELKRRNHVVRNQSVIISGESGAGKTEATKKIMQYLARVTRRGEGETGKSSLEDRVLSSNPLLESFGNARTLKNDNSSRFGKFIKISFDTESGGIVGASISNYLLEKTRITTQIEGERNYHIFYQIFSGADVEMLSKFGLEDGIEHFRYLGNRSTLKSRRDASAFEETLACLKMIGLSENDTNEVLAIIAAVLHIGNIEFEKEDGDGENAKMSEESGENFKKACTLLGLEEGKVSEAMLTKLLTVGGKTIHKPQDVLQASDKRDAFAKLAYSNLFLWLVKKINATLASEDALLAKEESLEFSPPPRPLKPPCPTGFIGVLDIYGFENFEMNGFEQLLINYANEKLQRHFNRHIFEVEQNLYSSEGVDWSYITFNDNRPCLELIEGGTGTVGILNTLEDCSGMGTASERDVNFLAQIHQKFGGVQNSMSTAKKKKKKGPESPIRGSVRHDNFITPKFGKDRDFIVVHYAGEVRYTVTGFVEKNVETLSNELKDLGSSSSKDFILDVFLASSSLQTGETPAAAPGRSRSTIRGISVASQFRTSLQMLVMDLECTQPHYVRCIKPNAAKSPNVFDSAEVLRQLRYAGMMETIRIRREGYALREEHESFYRRFHLLLSSSEASEGDGIGHLVKVLSIRLSLTDAEWQIGHSKIFLKRDLATKLETLAHLRVHSAARVAGRFGRKIARIRASNLLTAWVKLRLHLIRLHRLEAASKKISSSYRMFKGRKDYKISLRAVVKLQCLGRRAVARERVRRMRDPYLDMTFKELDTLHKEETSRMEAAASSKDFKLAADIEKKLGPLKEALESKRPLTRGVLEERISEVQFKIDDAVSRKAYSECAPLQEELDKLMKKRMDLPTIDELKEAVQKAEKDVADAAARRDFKGAASYQAALDNAKFRLRDAMEADPSFSESEEPEKDSCCLDARFNSRADLEVAIKETAKQVEDAISNKQFDKASTHQKELDELEGLRDTLPSLEEMQEKLVKLKTEMESAIQHKNFQKAESIQNEIDALEAKVEEERSKLGSSAQENTQAETPQPEFVNEKGDKIIFESRFKLEEEITNYKSLVNSAASSKKFKEAREKQALLDSLENLRHLLPTAQELKEKLAQVKADMEEAINKKEFEEAEQLHKVVEQLEEKLKLEQSNIPPPSKTANTSTNHKVATVGDTGQKSATATQPLTAAKVSVSKVKSAASVTGSVRPKPPKKVVTQTFDSRPVSRLRPKAPMISSSDSSVLAVVQMLANKRGDAAIITGYDGSLAGIITDTDVTRRLVAKKLPASSTNIASIMTSNPTCVSMSDPATDALVTMVENRFRHLPVTDDSGAIVGVLDIAKCLNDAISKLERSADKSSSAAEDAIKQMSSLQGAGGSQAALMQQLLGPLLAQAFGGQTSPTLRSILAGKPSTVVSPSASLLDVGCMMAEARKAALVVDNGRLAGIFGFKDMMTRAIAKELPLELTSVSSVMTPNPESVSPDTTVLEALQIMHDNKFLTLPVCEANGSVIGVVDVMDCVYASGGAEGWRSIFASAMECDDVTDTGSVGSYRRVPCSVKSGKSGKSSRKKDDRPVSKLRPKKPTLAGPTESVLAVTRTLASKRGDAALLVDASGALIGVITDTDITRRLVAKQLPPASTHASVIMTPKPTCVSMSDSAMDALIIMVENRFRHLPVVDDNGSVVGCLDIAKCLNDAITKLERAQEKSGTAAGDAAKLLANLQGGNNAALQMLLAQAFGGKPSPTLRSVLAGKPSTIVSPQSTLQTVGLMMAEARKAALVVDDNELVGIFGFKDMMTRAVAKDLPLDTTAVSSVMTPNPESVSPETTVLEALQIMHDNKFLTLPVREDNGRVVGLVDVMDCVYASGGAEGWKSLFDSALDEDDVSSVYSTEDSVSRVIPRVMVASHPNNIPLHVEVGKNLSGDDVTSVGESLTQAHPLMSVPNTPEPPSRKSLSNDDLVAYKVVDGSGHIYIIRAGRSVKAITNALEGKVASLDPSTTLFKYFDEEGDEILIKSDECLEEAVNSSIQAGNKSVKLSMISVGNSSSNNTLLIAGGLGLIATIVAVVLMKSKK